MRYQLQHLIGEGGQSCVYQALDTKTGELVAFKRYIESPKPDGYAWTQVIALPEWRDPNLVRYIDCGRDEKGAFEVMELLTGDTLADKIKDGPLPLPQFIDVARQVLNGLIVCHRLPIVHGDLKAENLMLSPWGERSFITKIFDFKLFEWKKTGVPARNKKHDKSIVGSVFTLAPEQINRQKIDARTDLYALGCVLYMAACGHQPFTGETNVQVVMAHLKHRVTPLQETRAKIGAPLCQWVMHLLACDPKDRPHSAEAALAAFEKALSKA